MTIAAPLLAALLAAPAATPGVGAIRMQLYYEYSGKLSKDIAPPVDFSGWNTIVGEGSAEEAANDLLVSVELRGPPGEAVAQPLVVVARARGRIIAQRRFANALVPTSGRLWKPLWLSDVGCAGRIDITATVGKSVRKSAISLDCGE